MPVIRPDIAERLDYWHAHVEAVFLSRLSPGAGLLPASTASTVHGDYAHAWVRDNVYSIFGAWALSRAARRHDSRQDRAERLEAAVLRVMRGLLGAMLAQADKVERFKQTQNPLDALHAKYDADTGAPVVEDDRWGHLQIDATSLFVLTLAQMTAGGLKIVQNADEAAFVQNLVHYLGPAYRIADYGMWERGRKTNDGSVEINASSVGMAKAALEAIRGVNLLDGAPEGRIHVPPDDIARARESLQALLPMESASKETDGALLSVIFWPAYAMADAGLLAETRDRLLTRLEGRHGLKRFLRDGHQTAVEDHGRLHYETGELARFDRIESEWPLFFTYLLVDARLRGDKVMGAHWDRKLEPLFVQEDGIPLLPELYVVPPDRVAAEVAAPGSQPRVPGENVPLLWAQSLWVTGALLGEGLIEPADIDPLNRRSVPGDTERGLKAPIRVCVLAEDDAAARALAAHGIAADTIEAVRGVADVRHAGHLRAWLSRVGANQRLGLTGRPPGRRLGAMSTARPYLADGGLVVFSPMLPEAHDSHLRQDAANRARLLMGDIRYLARHARGQDPVLLVATLDEASLTGTGAGEMVALLQAFQSGVADGIKVSALPLAQALEGLPAVDLGVAPPPGLARPDAPAAPVEVAGESACRARLDLARDAGDRAAMVAVQQVSARSGHWEISREAAAALGFVEPRLLDAVKDLVVRTRRLDLSPHGQTEQAIVSRPVAQQAVIERLAYLFGRGGRALPLVAQEIVIALGLLVKTDGAKLQGVRTLRLAEILELIAADVPGGVDGLAHEAPSALVRRLDAILDTTPSVRMLVGPGPDHALDPVFAPDQDWMAWRRRLGVLMKVRTGFYARVWSLLHAVDGIWFGTLNDPAGRLDAAVARGDFTSHERDFAHVLEAAITRIRDTRYRTFCLEALNVLAGHHERHPGARLKGSLGGGDIALDPLIHAAVEALSPGGATGEGWTRALACRPDEMARALHAAVVRLHPVITPDPAEPARRLPGG